MKGVLGCVIDKFKIVKEYVKPTDVATRYLGQPASISVDNHYYFSPFNVEKTPSLCANNKKGVITDFGKSGFSDDVIGFVGKLYHLPPIKACELIIADFNLPVNIYGVIDKKLLEKEIQRRKKVKQEAEIISQWFNETYIKLCNEYKSIQKQIKIFQKYGFRFEEALSILYNKEILLDIAIEEFISVGTKEDKAKIYEQRKEIDKLYEY